MAIDFQGAVKATAFVAHAHATYANVVDSANLFGDLFGFQAIPNAVFVDETGIIRYMKFGGFDIRMPADKVLAEGFAGSPNLEDLAAQSERGYAFEDEEARRLYRDGLERFKSGDLKSALELWRSSVSLVPNNWIVRKQIWALENPEKFYSGEVDFDWQKVQIAAGR